MLPGQQMFAQANLEQAMARGHQTLHDNLAAHLRENSPYALRNVHPRDRLEAYASVVKQSGGEACMWLQSADGSAITQLVVDAAMYVGLGPLGELVDLIAQLLVDGCTITQAEAQGKRFPFWTAVAGIGGLGLGALLVVGTRDGR